MKLVTTIALAVPLFVSMSSAGVTYAVVDTGQTKCFDARGVIPPPGVDEPFHGQDAQYAGVLPSYTLSMDGKTVRDNQTGLTWQQRADTDGDGVLDSRDKLTFAKAQAQPAQLNASKFGGFNDWRLPTIKELYSLFDARGVDPSGPPGRAPSGHAPFLDVKTFAFAYGDEKAGDRIIDAQYASATLYGGTTMGGNRTMFGVNFADGRIKGYPADEIPGRGAKAYFVLCVRGNPAYGKNQFRDNGDGTVTDSATGLTWQRLDSANGMNWAEALAYADRLELAGKTDWRLPDAKELQSIVDYGRAPATTGSAAIDPVFGVTTIRNEAGQDDFPCYWTSTTHEASGGRGATAMYVAFGRAMGYLRGRWMDVHGAGAQRSDPKEGDPADYPRGRGPQGDAIRILNYVRCVRGA